MHWLVLRFLIWDSVDINCVVFKCQTVPLYVRPQLVSLMVVECKQCHTTLSGAGVYKERWGWQNYQILLFRDTQKDESALYTHGLDCSFGISRSNCKLTLVLHIMY